MAKYKGSEPLTVEFPFIDGKMQIRPLTSQQKWDIESRMAVDPDTGKFVNHGEFQAELISASLFDEQTGARVFTVAELRDVMVGHFNELFDSVDNFHKADKQKKS